MMKRLVLLTTVLAAIAVPGFAGTDGEGFKTGACKDTLSGILPGSSGDVVRVPQDKPTIQAGVSAAQPGDTVLIDRGIYKEAVVVTTPGLRIRGTDRNGVVLDGGSTVQQAGFEVGIYVKRADRVLVENLTVHNYTRHGVFWLEVTGYWGRFLTAYNNGLYGLYAFDARCGQFDNSFTSGNADSGFYIGECYPCDAVITDIVAERNALGYSGTNAGGNLVLRDSYWHDNAMGIVPNSLDGEDNPPQRGATLKNNLVVDNNNCTAPGVSLAGTFCGVGVVIAGGQANSVYGNTITDHALGGLVLAPLPDQHLWLPSGNTMWGNVVRHDAAKFPRSFDLAQGAASGPNNCWENNTIGNSAPEGIQTIWACTDSMTTPPGGDARVEQGLVEGVAGLNGRDQADWETYPAPPAQTNQLDDDGDGSYADDGAPDTWLPALGM